MSRPLRLEYPGAFYHVLARGNESRDIFKDDEDRYRLTLNEIARIFGVDYGCVLEYQKNRSDWREHRVKDEAQ